MGTDWRLVKGFDINYINCSRHVRAKAKAVGNFCFYRKVERVYKVALRADEANCECESQIAYRTDNQALNDSTQGSVFY